MSETHYLKPAYLRRDFSFFSRSIFRKHFKIVVYIYMYTYFMCFGQEEEKKLQNVNKIFRLAGQPTRYILCIYIYVHFA